MIGWLGRKVRDAFLLLTWNIGYSAANPAVVEDSGEIPDIRWWQPLPTHQIQADPFFYGDTVLYEFMDRWRGRGEIWQAELDGSRPRPFLRASVHMSYPSVTHMDGTTYLICETHRGGKCLILALAGDADDVEEVACIDAPIADPTLLRHDGRFWLFGTRDARNENLHIWWADDMRGPWIAHAGNPVKRDPAGSRPAGNFYVSEKGLIRPTQDCVGDNGNAVILQRVVELTVDGFREEPLCRIAPSGNDGPEGFHTFNVSERGILVDGRRMVFHPLAPVLKALKLLRPSAPAFSRPTRVS